MMSSWKDIADNILEGQKKIIESSLLCMSKLDNATNQIIELNKSINKTEALLMARAELLIKCENSLKLLEKKYNNDTRSKTREKTKRKNILNKNLLADDIDNLRKKTAFIHKTYNIGTSNRLVHLMIVMRDLGFLVANVSYTPFLQLLMEWHVLLNLDSKRIHSVANGMSSFAEKLPGRGKIDFHSNAWEESWCRSDKEFCTVLASEYEKGDPC